MRQLDVEQIRAQAAPEYFLLQRHAEDVLHDLEDELQYHHCPRTPKERFHRILFNAIPDYLACIFAVTTEIEGKTVLDIGCGTTDPATYEGKTYRTHDSNTYAPWLSRVLNYLGANVIGVDVGINANETFTFRQANFMTESLPLLPNEQPDIALCFNVISSPELDLRYRHLLGTSFPDIAHAQLLSKLECVMPNGLFIHNRKESLDALKKQEARGLEYHLSDCENCKPQGFLEKTRALFR